MWATFGWGVDIDVIGGPAVGGLGVLDLNPPSIPIVSITSCVEIPVLLGDLDVIAAQGHVGVDALIGTDGGQMASGMGASTDAEGVSGRAASKGSRRRRVLRGMKHG